jgi:hypothetical protein
MPNAVKTPVEWIAIVAKEFADSDLLDGAIEAAELLIAPDLCGDRRSLLVAYLAAHLLTISLAYDGAIGAISSYKEGDVAITYNNGKSGIDSSDYNTTSYGRMYNQIASSCVIPIVMDFPIDGGCGCQ